MILGAALGAFITGNSLKVVKASFAGAISLIKPLRYNRDAYVELLKLVFDLLVKSRKEGLLAIENDIADPAKSPVFSKYPRMLEDHHMIEFITDCMRLMVGGNLDPHELEALLDHELETHHKEAHEPASDFLLWECAYAELHFSPKMWPDFAPADMAAAVADFHRRERRFGGLPEVRDAIP